MREKSHWTDLRDLDVRRRSGAEIRPKTPGQKKYLDAIRSHQVTICVGPPGCGKSLLCAAVAAEELRAGRVEKIVVARPMVECDEQMGFLPGGVDEKMAPFVAAMRSCLSRCSGPSEFSAWESSRKVEYHPLAVMRGLTFEKSFCLLDEAQNASYSQIRMFLTRFAESSRVVVNGDWYQSDIVEYGEMPPIYDVMRKMVGLKEVALIQLGDEDIVRSALVREIEKRLR